jgi:hypothetical protein
MKHEIHAMNPTSRLRTMFLYMFLAQKILKVFSVNTTIEMFS